MTINVGTIDRAARALLGLVLVAAPFVSGLALFASPVWTALSIIVGLVMLAVAATRICPVYTLLGIKTCRVA